MDRKTLIELTARPHLAGLDKCAERAKDDKEASRSIHDQMMRIIRKIRKRHKFKPQEG